MAILTSLLAYGASIAAPIVITKAIQWVGSPLANWGARHLTRGLTSNEKWYQKGFNFLSSEHAGGQAYGYTNAYAPVMANAMIGAAQIGYDIYSKRQAVNSAADVAKIVNGGAIAMAVPNAIPAATPAFVPFATPGQPLGQAEKAPSKGFFSMFSRGSQPETTSAPAPAPVLNREELRAARLKRFG